MFCFLNRLKGVLVDFICGLCLLLPSVSYTQSTNLRLDSLINLPYDTLRENFHNKRAELDTQEALNYASLYLKKAKVLQDTLNIAHGYRYLMLGHNDMSGLIYGDSIIALTEGKNYTDYPFTAYFLKGYILYKERRFEQSLENYIRAKNLNEKSFDKDSDILIKFNIAVIRGRLGYYEEAIKSLKITMAHFDKTKEDEGSLFSLFALSNAYRRSKHLDSAQYFGTLGLKKASSLNHERLYTDFLLNEGAILFEKKNYHASLRAIEKSLPALVRRNNRPNIAVAHYFLGRNYRELNEINKAILHFKKMDSVFSIINDLHPELRDGYKILINEYKQRGDLQSQLIYINKLLVLDSILNTNYKNVTKRLASDLDNPNLLKEKERVINRISSKNNLYTILILGLTILLVVSIVLLMVLRKKSKQNKQRIKDILNGKTEIGKPVQAKSNVKDLGLNEEVIAELLSKIDAFEKNKSFLNKQLTVYNLAKDMKTNPTYLSRVINHFKNENFSTYINSLRIQFIIEKLKRDPIYRKYTIKAIAHEAGFNTAESFSSAFYKNTGLKPSFFVKNMVTKARNS